ncbi:MAG TPA: hypothetical protein PKK33_10345, partial [Candidatus Cloacimonadota bacterium]|nr:hypothetical protein [Candidatus Cloacimonadota bacterium]
MSRQSIYLGTTAGDKTGTNLKVGGKMINDMTRELYDLRAKTVDLTAFVVNDEEDLYAHESQIVITRVGSKTLLLVMYMRNQTLTTEWELSGHAILKVFELTTKKLLKTFDLFYPGLSADLTMPADEIINVPRMYVTGATLKCFCPNESTLYERDIDISGIDPTVWTAGNLVVTEMYMKDSGGNTVLADVTSTNIQTHLKYVLGDDYAGYANMMPLFRNMNIAKSGINWYTVLEFSGEKSHELGNIAMCLTSSNSGVTWTFGTLIG